MKPGSKDKKIPILISGKELSEIKRHTWSMAEAFGLDSRIENYQGRRPIGLYMVTSNHILLMVSDNGERDTIPNPAGRGLNPDCAVVTYCGLKNLAATLICNKDFSDRSFRDKCRYEPRALIRRGFRWL